jgi:aflatoxin B1 aldehyde reductase
MWKVLGKLDLKGSAVDTKYYFIFIYVPMQIYLCSCRIYPAESGTFGPEKLRTVIHQSIKALKPYKIRIFYLHYPDRFETPTSFEDILQEINEFYKAGHMYVSIFPRLFTDLIPQNRQQFGLCNFFSWEVRLYSIAMCIPHLDHICQGYRVCRHRESQRLDTTYGLPRQIQRS